MKILIGGGDNGLVSVEVIPIKNVFLSSGLGGDGGGEGTVTSVAIAPTDGLQVDSGSPITTAGTITLGVDAPAMRAHLNVANGATANASDSDLLNRANHTGSQLSSTISDFNASVSGVIESTLRENNTVLFDKNYIIGNAGARTGNILFDFTGAKLGAETEMRHADAGAFIFDDDGGTIDIKFMFDVAQISTTVDNYFLMVLTDKTPGAEVVKVFHALEGGIS